MQNTAIIGFDLKASHSADARNSLILLSLYSAKHLIVSLDSNESVRLLHQLDKMLQAY